MDYMDFLTLLIGTRAHMVKDFGTLLGKFKIQGDYVILPEDTCTIRTCAQSAIEFNMKCTAAGTGIAGIQVIGSKGTSDSVRLQVVNDAGTHTSHLSQWHFGSATRTDWTWIEKTFTATVGHHKLRILGREDGVKIKQIRISGACVLYDQAVYHSRFQAIFSKIPNLDGADGAEENR